MLLNDLQKKNPSITIHSLTDECFAEYGRILTGFDFSECMNIMAQRKVPAEGNCYIASDDEMMATRIADTISRNFYGGMPVEIGYCNGRTRKMDALEYHKGSEINAAVYDMIVLLDSIKNIHNNILPSSGVKAFLVPAGTAIELYGTTLHFAPCAVSDTGYKSIVVLPAGTNEVLDELPSPQCDEDKLLWMKNKWLIAHKDSAAAEEGAYVGITGTNIEIFLLKYLLLVFESDCHIGFDCFYASVKAELTAVQTQIVVSCI